MNVKVLVIINALLAFALTISSFPSGGVAVLCAMLCAFIVVWAIKRADDIESAEKDFLLQVFLAGLIFRVTLASVIYLLKMEETFGPDALGYHRGGTMISDQWWQALGSSKVVSSSNAVESVVAGGSSNWGMNYFVAVIYFLLGSNALTISLLSSVCGAATAPLLYFCANFIFKNRKVARFSALFTAIFPAMIIWSSQGLKDGFIVFFLVLGMLAILRLQKTFSYFNIGVLLFVMLGIFTFRFYLFPLLALSAIGGFLISSQTSVKDIFSRAAVLLLIGIFLTLIGVTQQSQEQMEQAGNLKRIENVRRGGNQEGESGFNNDADVSTVSGALAALPVGVLNLLMAPFPWQMKKLTQVMLLPEMILWWFSLPLTFMGLWYVFKNKFRENISILIFVAVLGLSYSLFQGNIGTMYRQRTQIQVFLFVFTAVGVTVLFEKREMSKILRERRQQINRARVQSIR